VSGNVEAVKDGLTGFLVSPEDPGALSAAILRLLSDPIQAKTIGGDERFTAPSMLAPALPFPITTNGSKRVTFGYIVAQDVAGLQGIMSLSH
jgi:glycosyltransferase involved in cell wall biosynthesis